MKILSIETSCDETAICLLKITENDSRISFEVLGNITHSQVELHREFGGVFPALAKREYLKNLPIILETIMATTHPLPPLKEGAEHPNYICVTSGPGLEPALWCGIVFAKELGEKWNIPVIPVNHMEGHILSVLVPGSPLLPGEGLGVRFEFKNSDIQFPALALLISGGHTELVLVKNIGDYEIIGKTRDDAVGEAFDKVARILGLPYPGGVEISRLAGMAAENLAKPNFPRPMLHTKDFDFSFSGLKTAVLYYTQTLPQPISEQNKISIAHEFENTVADVLVYKTKKAIEEFGAQTLIIGGGVSANTHIKNEMKKMIDKDFPETKLFVPQKDLTGDNALMIALAGYFKIKKSPNAIYDNIRAEGNLSL